MPPLDAQWVRVTQLADGDDEWEVAEDTTELVTLDVSGARAAGIDPELGPGTQVSVTGLETETPMLKAGSTVFMGKWDTLLGSEIILESYERADDDGESRTALRPLGAEAHESTARRRITFTPVRAVFGDLQPKSEDAPEPMHQDPTE
ncbi:hypothetical protein MCUN1_002158 [Malassezia cuniculi]|uniref:Transcription factor TFIIIC triple barrel domain-containing protein n=1 Tax=Malassezia cuniculi TaxID=948313 RepID=A0AAF0J694_9BASI|nr:hypothetical protein MCUN1_002158 [Malassezia cuniculi]